MRISRSATVPGLYRGFSAGMRGHIASVPCSTFCQLNCFPCRPPTPGRSCCHGRGSALSASAGRAPDRCDCRCSSTLPRCAWQAWRATTGWCALALAWRGLGLHSCHARSRRCVSQHSLLEVKSAHMRHYVGEIVLGTAAGRDAAAICVRACLGLTQRSTLAVLSTDAGADDDTVVSSLNL